MGENGHIVDVIGYIFTVLVAQDGIYQLGRDYDKLLFDGHPLTP